MKAAKLNQIIAVEQGVKSQNCSEMSSLNKVIQKPALFNGLNKKYEAKDSDGETYPDEKQRVQYNAREVLRSAERSLSDLMEITARKDWTNCQARADVVVDDEVILSAVPITYLLFLEKNTVDLRTFVKNMPTLDEAEEWKLDNESGLYKSSEIRRQKTTKAQEPIVLYPATPEHPAQTEIITKDVVVGYWSEIKHSGSLPLTEKNALLERIEKLIRAIKAAREEANGIEEVKSPDVGSAIFGYLMPEEAKPTKKVATASKPQEG